MPLCTLWAKVPVNEAALAACVLDRASPYARLTTGLVAFLASNIDVTPAIRVTFEGLTVFALAATAHARDAVLFFVDCKLATQAANFFAALVAFREVLGLSSLSA